MQCLDEAAFDADRALAGGPGFAIGCDDAARPRRFGDGRAEGGVGRADLIGMDHALAVEPEFAPLTAGGGKALGIGEVDDLIRGVELGIDSFDCAMPTRLARHGVALVADPSNRWRLEVDRPAFRSDEKPLIDGCPCPACAGELSRGYLHYLSRSREVSGARLLTLHNLTFIASLMARLRGAILDGRLGEVASELREGR